MNKMFAAILALGMSFVMVPRLGAATIRTDLDFAFTENGRPGTHLWCAFPDIAGRWIFVVYERQLQQHSWPARRYMYFPLAAAIKPAGASGDLLHQMITVPPHASPACLLVAYRNGIQQPYRGWTAFNPFGWHAFGTDPLQTRVAEIPPGTPGADIRNYQHLVRGQWPGPVP
jgi:hypothetical protein